MFARAQVFRRIDSASDHFKIVADRGCCSFRLDCSSRCSNLWNFSAAERTPYLQSLVYQQEAHAMSKLFYRDRSELLCTLSTTRVCGSSFIRFPFRILQGTVELELQVKSTSFGQREEVFLYPTLCVSDPEQYPKNVVKTKPMGQIDRSRKLALLQPKPTIEMCETSYVCWF